MFLDSEILKHGIKENYAAHSVLKTNNIVWEHVALKLDLDCKFATVYQYKHIKKQGVFCRLTGRCQRGQCQINLVILDNPFSICKVRAKIALSVYNHSYHEVQDRLCGEKRKIYAERTIEEGTKVTHLNQFKDSNKKNIFSLNVLQKAKSERTKLSECSYDEFCQELNICRDLQLKSHCMFIQSLDFHPFSLTLFDINVLKYLADLNKKSDWETPLILSADVSGEIFYKPGSALSCKKNTPGVLTFSLCAPNAVALLDSMLESTRSLDISTCLLKFVHSYRTLANGQKLGHIIVIDFSWPLLNAFMQSYLNTTVDKYLFSKFSYLTGRKKESEDESVILIDMLHLVKIFWLRSKKITKNTHLAKTFVIAFTKILFCRSLAQCTELWRSIVRVFGYSHINSNITECMIKICEETDKVSFDFSVEENLSDYIKEDGLLKQNGIRQSSPFRSYFQEIADQVSVNITCSEVHFEIIF